MRDFRDQASKLSRIIESNDKESQKTGKSMVPPPFQLRVAQLQNDEESEELQSGDGEETAKGVAVASQVSLTQPSGVPAGYAPNPNMTYSRHVVSKSQFVSKTAGNSLLLQNISESQLGTLYREAAWHQVKDGVVKLKNGQSWYINASTGKFYPVSGPGIVNLSSAEMGMLSAFRKAAINKGPEAAIEALQKQLTGRGMTISSHMQQALEVLATKYKIPSNQLLRGIGQSLEAASGTPADLTSKAQAVSKGKPFKIIRWGGRLVLVVAIAYDVYRLYQADFAPKEVVKTVGGWTGSAAAGGVAASYASPLLAGGPWGWVGYGVIVGGASIGGYFAGEQIAETVYEWGWEETEDSD